MSAIHGNQSGTIPALVLGVTMVAFGNTMTKMTTKGPAPQANPARAERVTQLIRHPCISCAEILLLDGIIERRTAGTGAAAP